MPDHLQLNPIALSVLSFCGGGAGWRDPRPTPEGGADRGAAGRPCACARAACQHQP
ncbi:hypothetical protein CBM2633_A90099 [Cupriavidus taiwanensis]|nr:hypothetical protein CBM2633_A90099 [Cupriavidus taiwanensis]